MEPADYRQAMRAFATGVAIIACGRGGARAGCVATAVASLSLTPPSLIVNLQREGSTLKRMRAGGHFSVNFLSAAQEPLARRFAEKRVGRFTEGAWIDGASGAPVLADALAALECRIEDVVERFTHAIVIAQVEAAHVGEGPALLHFGGSFRTL